MVTSEQNNLHLSYLQDQLLLLSADLYDDFFKSIDTKLMDLADSATSNEHQWTLFSLARELKVQKTQLCGHFDAFLIEGFVQFELNILGNHQQNAEEDQSSSLSLVANEELERKLAISSLARRLETRNTEALFAINHRLSILKGGKKLESDANPIGPAQFSGALSKMLETLELDSSKLNIFCHSFEAILHPKLKDFYSEINEYLISQGILPNLRYNINKKTEAPESKKPVDDEQSEAESDKSEMTEPKGQPSNQNPNNSSGNASSSAEVSNYQQRMLQTISQWQQQIFSSSPNGGEANNDQQSASQQGQQIQSPSAGSEIAGTGSAGSAVNSSDGQTTAEVSDSGSQGAAGSSSANQSSGKQSAASESNNESAAQGVQVVSQGELVSALHQVQSESGAVECLDADTVELQSVEQLQQVTHKVRQQVGQDKAIEPSDMHAIDLVGMVFEFMLSDDQLPDSVKAVLSYLHTPFLKIALLDQAFFEKTEHPARQLLNLLAESGRKWVNSNGASQFQIFPKIKSVVRRVLVEFEGNENLIDELLLEMEEFNEKVSRKIDMLEQRARAKAEGEEKLRMVKRRVYGELKGRMDATSLPAPIVVLLLHPWADYMIFTALRFGYKSELWQNSLRVTNDILWSVQLKHNDEDRAKQQKLMSDLPVTIKQAIGEVAFDSSKANKLITLLQEIQNKALNAQVLIPVELQQQQKIEQEINLDLYMPDDEEVSPQEQAMLNSLKSVEMNSWLEYMAMNDEDKYRARIAWYNPKTEHFMLVDNASHNVTMTRALDVARDVLSERARIVENSSKPFFERALEAIIVRMRKITQAA